MLTEIKRPEVGPNADELTSLTRGRGPRRGNLEELLKYWRPIMKKPGGFRRCVVILMDKPQFGGRPQRICAWLHHEITGKWPNEGKGKRGRGRGGKRRSRSVRRVRSAARRAKSDVFTPETFEISPLSLVIRESRDFGGVLVQPIAGRQSAVELKAAMFSTYSNRVVVVSGDVDEKRVGVVGSNTAIGQAVQAAGSIILPGDISDFRSPIRSQIYETLTPGGGGGRRRPSARRLIRGTGRQARNKFRCPPGYQKGGTFTNSQFSTCGAQILGIPGKGVGSPSSGAQRALAALARDASLVREIGDLRSNRNPYDIIRAAQIPVAPKKGSPTRRQTSINNVLSRSDEADFSIRAVRRDGVILEPVVSLQALGKLDEFDDLADGTLVDTYKNGQIGKDLVPAFSTGLRDVYVSIPEAGAVKISRVGGELSPTEVDSLRRTFPTSIRRAANLPDPSGAIRDYADRSDGRFTVEFGELKNNRFDVANSKNELIRVQTAGGKTLTVPQWVYETFLSRSAPRRAKDAPVYEIVSEQKTINPFLIAGKSVPLSVVPLSSKQAEIDFRAMYFSQMLDSDGVKVRRPRGPRGGRTRAIFDANLNRYRCPPGTRYGGRISDKFGRNCGYSLPRQIVNALVDFGVRIEDRLDRRGRRRRGVDTQPGDRGGVNANVRADLDDIFQRLDNIEKELGLAFDKVEDRRPGRVGPTIGERRARQDLTDREKELLEGNDLAEAIEDLGRIIDGPEFDDASNEELREAFRRVEKAANLEAGRLTETPPRSPEQRGMAQRILDAIARILDRLADRLDGGDRVRGRDRDRDVAPAPRGRDGGGRPRAPRDRDRDRDVLPRAPRRPGDPPTDEERREDRRRVRELSDEDLLREYQGIEDRLDGNVRRAEYKRLLEAEIRRRRLDPNQPVPRRDERDSRIDDRDAPEPPDNVLDRLQQRAEEFDKRFGGRTGDFVQDLSDSELDDFINALEENADDLGEEGRDILGRLRFERNRRRRDDNGVLSVLNDMQAQQEDFDKRFGGKTLRWVEQVGDEDLDRFIDALERADADLIGEEGAKMLRNLIAERDRRNRPPKSGDDILREIRDRAEAFDLRFGGRTNDFVSDLDDAELNRFIDGLRRFDVGDEGREMLDRLVNERNLRKAAPAPHRRRVEDVNVGRRALNRNRRQNIEEFDDLSPENRVNLIHQAGVEFDELAEEWRVALGADDLNGFSEADMRDFVARKIKNNDSDARLWRRRYNDFLELNELNRKLDAAQNDEDVDNALNDHVGRLAAARRNSIVNARGANAADRPNRNDGRDDRGGAVPPPNNVDNLIEEVNNVNAAGNLEQYEDAELNDRLDMLDAEYRRYGADIDGPPPRRLAQARDALRRERNRRDADGGADGAPDGGTPAAEPLGNILQQRVDVLNGWTTEDFDRLGAIGNGQLLDDVYNELNGEVRRIIHWDGIRAVPADLRAALNKVSENRDRLRRERDFQVNRPIQDRDDAALNRHLQDLLRLEAAVPEDLVGDIQSEINELQSEIDRRQNLQAGARDAVDSVPGGNRSVVRRLLSGDWRGIRRRKDAERQKQLEELAERRYGDERPYDLKVGDAVGVEAYRLLSQDEKEAHLRKMFSDGVTINGGTATVDGVTYRKEVIPNVTNVYADPNTDGFSVSGNMRLKVYRLNDDGTEELVADELRTTPFPYSGFSRHGVIGDKVKHGTFGIKTYWDPATGDFYPEAGKQGQHVDFRGGGVASEFNANAFLFYRGVGVKSVGVSAIDDGHAAWPAQGYRENNGGTIRRLNENMAELAEQARGFREAVAAGRAPTPKQIHAGILLRAGEGDGDSDPLERLEALVEVGRNAGGNADEMPGHYEFINALSPIGADGELGRNDPAFRAFKDVRIPAEARAEMQQYLDDNNIDVRVPSRFQDRVRVPEFNSGELDISRLELPRPPTDPRNPARKSAFIRKPVAAYRRFLGRGDKNERAIVGDAVPVGENGINNAEDAVAYMARGNGGLLADVPDQFLRDAIQQNPDRFTLTHDAADGGGINGMMRYLDQDTGQYVGIKFGGGEAYGVNEAYGEMVGNGLAERLGFPVGQIRMDGPQGTGADGGNPTPTIVVDLAFNGYGVSHTQGGGLNPAFVVGGLGNKRDNVRMSILDMITGNSDRHGGNYFRIAPAGERDKDLYPIDFGLSGPAGLYSPDDVRSIFLGDAGGPIDRMTRWRNNSWGGTRNGILAEMASSRDADRDAYRREVEAALEDLRANHRDLGGLDADIDLVTNIPGHTPSNRDNFDVAMSRVQEHYEWFINASTDDVMRLLFG